MVPSRSPTAPIDTPLTAIGVPIIVRCHGARAAEVTEHVRDAWRDCSASCWSGDLVVDVLLDDDRTVVEDAVERGMVAATSVEVVMDRLSPRITSEAITRNAGKLTMLHACGLAAPETGAAVALVARSGTGKTTVSRTLGSTWSYLSDETVAIRPDLTVVPYPKPLSILANPGDLTKQQTAASALRLVTVSSAPRLVGLALLDRDPEGPDCELTDVPTVLALAELAPQTSFLSRFDRPLQHMAKLVTSVGGLQRVRYREAAVLQEVVADLVRRTPCG